MRKLFVAMLAALFALSGGSALAFPTGSSRVADSSVGSARSAGGPSGSTECHMKDDDCDGAIDEDVPDDDGDGQVNEDAADGIDNDGDGLTDEDTGTASDDEDGDGNIDEDAPGNAADDPGENQVDCGDSGDVGGVAHVYAGPNGAEVCADDGSAVPVDGRVVVDLEDGYVAIDGDNSNPGASNGYARIDEDGPHCGNAENQDSGADQSANSEADCG